MNEKPPIKPPALAQLLLSVLIPEEYRDDVLGDATEEFDARSRSGRFARLWYWRQLFHIDVWRLRREAWSAGAVRPRRNRLMLDSIRFELREAFRVFKRAPAFSVAIVLTLAVGIGGTTTIFNLINSLLLRPVPGIESAQELAVIESSQGGGAFGISSFADHLDFVPRARSFASLAAFKPRRVDVDAGNDTESVTALLVTSSYFPTLGVEPALGRFFADEVDTGPSSHPQVVLTSGFWKRRFAEDPEVLGSTLRLNGRSYTVIGVAPPRFIGTQMVEVPEVFVPMTMQPDLMPESGYLLERRGWGGIYQIGRLADGTTLAMADQEVRRLGEQLAEEYPRTNAERAYRAIAFRDGALPGGIRGAVAQMSALLLAVVVALWMVVCLNVSSLFLARALERRREMAIRAALGAGRTRLGGAYLLEVMAIALVAGVVGMGVARMLSSLLVSLPLPIAVDPGVDLTTIAFAGGLAVLSAVVCAFAPSLVMSRIDPREAGGKTSTSSSSPRRWLSRVLIVGQMSVSLVLLFGTGLFVRSFVNLTSADPGFDASRLATAQVNPGLQGYDESEMVAYYDRLVTRLARMPGVAEVTMAQGLPSTENFGRDSWFLQSASDPQQSSSLYLNVVSPNYFSTLGIPIVSGRSFTSADTPDQPAVTIINEATARLVERRTGQPALGQRMSPEGPDGPFLEIVGIVGDNRTGRAAAAAPFVYGAHSQMLPLGLGGQEMVVMLKTSVPPEAVMGGLRQAAREVDPLVSTSRVMTMERFLSELLVVDRLIVTALGVSSLLAMLLVAAGIYGLLAYVVGQRTREFGIRLALGARAASLRSIILKEALVLAGVGLVLGGIGGLAVMRVLQDQLFGVGAWDPASLIAVCLLVVGVTLAAAYAPARRAMRADPLIAIKAD